MDIEDIELLPSDEDFAMEEDLDEETKTYEPSKYGKVRSFATEGENQCNTMEEMDLEHQEYSLIQEEIEVKLRRRKERFGIAKEESEKEEDPSWNRGHQNESKKNRSKERKSRYGRGKPKEDINFNKARLFKSLYEGYTLQPDILAREIAYRLEERKVMVIKNVVTVLGKGSAMDLFDETVRLQKGRGIKTADGKRRRTSGGVFLYLLKERASKEEWDKIFKEDKEINKQREKRKRQLEKEERLMKRKEELLKKVENIEDNATVEKEAIKPLDEIQSTEIRTNLEVSSGKND